MEEVWNYTFFIDRKQQVSRTGYRKPGLKNCNGLILKPFSRLPLTSPGRAWLADISLACSKSAPIMAVYLCQAATETLR